MKIECPSCHLKGNMPDHDIPAGGRRVSCPKCKTAFQVQKDPAESGTEYLMNLCPNCQYSTFSEEMFAVCPKCGMDGRRYREMLRKQQEAEQLRRDEASLRPKYGAPPEPSVAIPEPPAQETLPPSVMAAGWTCVLAGAAILVYGGTGLYSYYGTDWVALLADSTDEPVSKLAIFWSKGFLPWLAALYGLAVLLLALMFQKLAAWSRVGLEAAAWLGGSFMVCYELYDFVAWVRRSSSSPTIGYYAAGILDALVMIALWGIPAAVLIRFLRGEGVRRIFGG